MSRRVLLLALLSWGGCTSLNPSYSDPQSGTDDSSAPTSAGSGTSTTAGTSPTAATGGGTGGTGFESTGSSTGPHWGSSTGGIDVNPRCDELVWAATPQHVVLFEPLAHREVFRLDTGATTIAAIAETGELLLTQEDPAKILRIDPFDDHELEIYDIGFNDVTVWERAGGDRLGRVWLSGQGTSDLFRISDLDDGLQLRRFSHPDLPGGYVSGDMAFRVDRFAPLVFGGMGAGGLELFLLDVGISPPVVEFVYQELLDVKDVTGLAPGPEGAWFSYFDGGIGQLVRDGESVVVSGDLYQTGETLLDLASVYGFDEC